MYWNVLVGGDRFVIEGGVDVVVIEGNVGVVGEV